MWRPERSQLCGKTKQRKGCSAKQYKRWRILTGIYCYANFLKDFLRPHFNQNHKNFSFHGSKNTKSTSYGVWVPKLDLGKLGPKYKSECKVHDHNLDFYKQHIILTGIIRALHIVNQKLRNELFLGSSLIYN